VARGDGTRPPEAAEKSLGEIVSDVSEKASLLVREEIELAKAEVRQKVSRLGKGAAAGGAAAVLAVFALVYLFHGLAYLLADVLSSEVWVGYGIVTGFLLLLAAAVGLLGLRWVKRGAPPTPQLAIEEARRTRETLEEARWRREALESSRAAGEALREERG
jgi:uncharacterized membrane protein YqjE